MPAQPNILVILSDEHDVNVTGCYGDPVVQTPNLDRLAADGVTFDGAYTTSPLCVPARLSFTACQYVSNCGAWTNSDALPSDDYPSLMHQLNAAGYDCILGGKMHYDATRRYGFRDLFYTNQNQYHKTGHGPRRRGGDFSPNPKSWAERSSEFYVGDESRVMDLDREVTEKCSAFLRERKPSDKPFFLLAGYLGPHFPLIVPDAYYQRYKDRVPMPEIPEGLLESLPENYKHLRAGFGVEETDPDVVKRGRELYWAFVDWVDDQIGLLLESLDDSDVADNTLVVYTADHGENKGDHGLWWKNCMYEHSARVPLIVRWPRRWTGGQRRAEACSLVDLVQTLADVAGAERLDSWDGVSMKDWLDNPSAGWRDLAVSEYYGHNIASGFAMIRRGPWKYVYHNVIDEEHPAERELYNLDEDPKEFHNLAADSEHTVRIQHLHADLVAELGREPGEAELEYRRTANR